MPSPGAADRLLPALHRPTLPSPGASQPRLPPTHCPRLLLAPPPLPPPGPPLISPLSGESPTRGCSSPCLFHAGRLLLPPPLRATAAAQARPRSGAAAHHYQDPGPPPPTNMMPLCVQIRPSLCSSATFHPLQCGLPSPPARPPLAPPPPASSSIPSLSLNADAAPRRLNFTLDP
ncbi:formin-like protein 14 [Triticum aestivum]|uniref:formin-like protein 14 n=1 Tax=Triticum aestivum TaxID=4565 RepID=UPI001D030DDD|nr:formin-like protein 14 [Triticum aestivum]